MAKLDKPEWMGTDDYTPPTGAPDDDLEVLVMQTLEKVNVLHDEIATNTDKVSLGVTGADSLTFAYNSKASTLDIVVVAGRVTKRASIALK